MRVELQVPRAVLLDVGDTVLEERRFDLEAGIEAVVRDADNTAALVRAFRADTAGGHRRSRELLLAGWLRERVPSLASMSVASVEDAIWDAVVTLAPRPGIDRVLNRLADDGVPAAAVSNAAFSGRVLLAELTRHGLADRLRFVVSSADVGARKPAAAIFDAAVARLGVAASQTWFVGDTLDEDVAGAFAAGLQPVLFASGVTADWPAGVPVVRDWEEFMQLYAAVRRANRDCAGRDLNPASREFPHGNAAGAGASKRRED